MLGGRRLVPWSGLVDALQHLIAIVFPWAERCALFGALRVVNPLAMSAIAVDSLVTATQAAFGSGSSIPTLDRLTERMREHGASLVVDLGEGAGEQLHDALQQLGWK
jgi:hypothetical protein